MKDTVKDIFFSQNSKYAIWGHFWNGIPASFKLAQAALESNYGQSELAKKYKNFFGIKGDGVKMASGEYTTYGYQIIDSDFRAYKTAHGSFKDNTVFLKENKRYSKAFQTDNPFDFAEEIADAGYATDPYYAAKIKNIINENDLTRYDGIGDNRILIKVLFSISVIAGFIYLAYKLKWFTLNLNK